MNNVDLADTTSWGILDPSRVSQWINFDRDEPNWQYNKDNPVTMPDKQIEGVAYLWNLLSKQRVAILADEVGMGKTFQALGLISLLWKMKPHAKILIMAPNRDICKHWVKEYHSFLNHHYREADHTVRNIADGGAIHEPQLCWNLKELQRSVKQGWGHLFITTIHSLSGLVDDKSRGGLSKADKASNEGARIHNNLKKYLGDSGFDLVVIDEAHYFRNVDGGSQKVNAAKAFFGDTSSPLAQKTLLMTATPSHTSMKDVNNILSYFVDFPEEGCDYRAILDKYLLRRLRLMQGASTKESKDKIGKETLAFNKFHYRNEKEIVADFSNSPESELFFALYQKQLVDQQDRDKSGKRFLYGYLEGFESVGAAGIKEWQAATSNDPLLDDTEYNKVMPQSFNEAPDTKLLEKLSADYYAAFQEHPKHPKYDAVVNRFVPKELMQGRRDLHEDKHLVFVRRIPSVREMTKRVNTAYDKPLLESLLTAWGLTPSSSIVKTWQKTGWSRQGYVDLLESIGETNVSTNIGDEEGELDDLSAEDFLLDDNSTEDEDIEQGLFNEESLSSDKKANSKNAKNSEDESRLGSVIAELFVVKKVTGKSQNDEVERTDCSNVRLRFIKPESLFGLFLEPASDYMDGSYSVSVTPTTPSH